MEATTNDDILDSSNNKANENLSSEAVCIQTNKNGNSPINLTTDKNNKINITSKEPSENKDDQVMGDQCKVNKSEESIAANCDPKNIKYEGDIAVYTDPESGSQYEWSVEKSEWILRHHIQYENDTHVYTDKDGYKFFWDKDKNAWFPKIDADFMAQYQMNYGFVDNQNSTKDPTEKVDKKEPIAQNSVQAPTAEKRKASEPAWFEVDEKENTKVYISNLPCDITEQEFIDLMQKCGLIMRDPETGNFKIKLYKDPGTDYLKGDALCTYIRIESVQLALNLLDGYDFKGHKLKVERAKFQMKGEYDPKLKPKMKKRKEKIKLRKIQDKLFDWRPEKVLGERGKHEKTVIIKNLFEPSIFDNEVGLILEFQEDLREEAAKIGTCRKVILYDRHPEGVAQINMSNPEEADEVVKLLNGRWFMKRQLTAETWDGKTKYKIAETDAQMNQRLDGWDKFLESDKEKSEKSEKTN